MDDEIDRERQEWLHDIEDIPAERFVFLDESNAKTNMTRRYGRALRGERVVDYVPDARYESLTMLSALDHQGRTTCVVYEGGTDIPVMRLFAEEFLAPMLQPGQIVVMDNLSAHHDAGVVAALEATGAEVWFQPRYSPEFNPIEKMWSKVKARLRTIKARAKETLTKAIGEALEAVTPTDAANWFQSCGYTKIQT